MFHWRIHYKYFHREIVDLMKSIFFTTDHFTDRRTEWPWPVVANYTEHFEQTVISTAIHKPTRWYRYLVNTFVVWPDGKRALQEFLKHLNGIHENIKFSMKIQENGALSLLDFLVTRIVNGRLDHTIYRMPTHTYLYLHAKSEYHPAKKWAVLTTLL